MKEEEFFNKLIDATSNILTKVVEELNRFRTDNNEIVEIKKKEKRNEVIKKCELKEPKNSIEDDEIKMCFVIINSIQKVLFKLCNDSLNKVEKWELKQRLIHLQETLDMIVTNIGIKKIISPILVKSTNLTTKSVIEMIKSRDMIVKDLRNYSSNSNITSVTSS